MPLDAHPPAAVDGAAALNKRGLAYLQAGDIPQAMKCFTAVINQQSSVFVDGAAANAVTVAVAYSHLSTACRVEGRLPEALEHALAALKIRTNRSPTGHSTGESHAAVAALYRLLGQLSDARLHLEKAIAIEERMSKRSLHVSRLYNELGLVLHAEERLDAAAAQYNKSLSIRQEQIGGDDLYVATTLNNLAMIDLAKGNTAEAGAKMKRAVDLHRRLAPDASAERCTLLGNYASLLVSQGHLDDALVHFRQSLELKATRAQAPTVDEKRADMLESIAIGHSNIGHVLHRQGKLEQALAEFRKGLVISQDIAPGSLSVAAAHRNIGLVLQAQGQLQAAASEYRCAIRIEEVVAPQSLELGATYNNLGSVLSALGGQKEQAVQLYHKALAIQRVLAPDGLDASSTHHNIGQAMLSDGRLNEAMEHLQRSMAIRAAHDRFSPSCGSTQVALGIAAALRGSPVEAERQLLDALEIEERLALSTVRNKSTLETILAHLGVLYAHKGKTTEALVVLNQARGLSKLSHPAPAGELSFTVCCKKSRSCPKFFTYDGDLEGSGDCFCVTPSWIDVDDSQLCPSARDFAAAQSDVAELQVLTHLAWLIPPDHRNVLRALHVHEMPMMVTGRVLKEVPRYFFYDCWDMTLEEAIDDVRNSNSSSSSFSSSTPVLQGNLRRVAADIARGLAVMHRQGLVCHQYLSSADIVLARGHWKVSPVEIPGVGGGGIASRKSLLPADIRHPSALADAWLFACSMLEVADALFGTSASHVICSSNGSVKDVGAVLEGLGSSHDPIVASCVLKCLQHRGDVSLHGIAQELSAGLSD